MSYTATTAVIDQRATDLLLRAEDAYQAINSTWSPNRAERLSVLVARYATIAEKLTADLVPISRPAHSARRTRMTANASRRQARTLARSLAKA